MFFNNNIKKILFIVVLFILFFEIIISNLYYFLIVDNIDVLFCVRFINNNIMQNENKSEILNCLYISRYMGQDWNKKFFYIDNYGNLTDYCKYLITHIKDELNINSGSNVDIARYNYYKFINELILHARECIDLTSTDDINKCNYIESLIEKQVNIKKNMCLLDVDNELCNQIKVNNNTPLLNGYLDKNMINFGRDFYSKDRNYKIHNLPKLNNVNEIDNKEIIITLGIICTISILIYSISK
jgi:hypothetical protein